ncbi:hypothetical protein K438DRAFT_1970875 [Mycena galopus ATCC 62051]|nr:hypothetical protein K438DRAFT_1970875 [Mycena galopus ATCC 62051]
MSHGAIESLPAYPSLPSLCQSQCRNYSYIDLTSLADSQSLVSNYSPARSASRSPFLAFTRILCVPLPASLISSRTTTPCGDGVGEGAIRPRVVPFVLLPSQRLLVTPIHPLSFRFFPSPDSIPMHIPSH